MVNTSLAGTPEICSNLLRSRHVEPPEQTLSATQNDVVKETRKGIIVILPKQSPSNSIAVGTTCRKRLSSTAIFLHQFTKTPSTFESTATGPPPIFSLLAVIVVATPPAIFSLLDQFTKTPSTFSSTAATPPANFSLLAVNVVEDDDDDADSSSASVVLDTQDDEETETISPSPVKFSGEQEVQRLVAGIKIPAPEKRFPSRFPQIEQREDRR